MGRPSNALKSEYISVSELAKIVGRSQQTIYKKMRQKPSFNRFVKVFDGKKYIHKSAVFEEFGVSIDGFNPVDSKNGEMSKPVDALAAVLSEQLKDQAEQIKNLQRTIDNLSEMLKAEQVLRANADRRIAYLEDLQQKDQGNYKADPAGSASDQDKEPNQEQNSNAAEAPKKGPIPEDNTAGNNSMDDQKKAQQEATQGHTEQPQTRTDLHLDRNHDKGQETNDQQRQQTFIERLKRLFWQR